MFVSLRVFVVLASSRLAVLTAPIPPPPLPHPPPLPRSEYRVLLGHPRLADVFVDTSKIGTDALFERCTHFAPLDTRAYAHLPPLQRQV